MKWLFLLIIFPIYGSAIPQLQQAANLIQEISTNNELDFVHTVQWSDNVYRLVRKDASDQIVGSIFDVLINNTSVEDIRLIDQMLLMLTQHHIATTNLENVADLGDYLATGILTVPQLPDFDFIAYPGEEGRLLLRLKDYLNNCESLLQDIYIRLQGVSLDVEPAGIDPLTKIHNMLNFQAHEGKKNCEIFFGDKPFILLTPQACAYFAQLLLQTCQSNPETDFRLLFRTIKGMNLLFRTTDLIESEYFVLDCRLEVSSLEQELERVDHELYQEYLAQRPASVNDYEATYQGALYKALTSITDYCREMRQKILEILNEVRSDSLGVRQYNSEEILAR